MANSEIRRQINTNSTVIINQTFLDLITAKEKVIQAISKNNKILEQKNEVIKRNFIYEKVKTPEDDADNPSNAKRANLELSNGHKKTIVVATIRQLQKHFFLEDAKNCCKEFILCLKSKNILLCIMIKTHSTLGK